MADFTILLEGDTTDNFIGWQIETGKSFLNKTAQDASDIIAVIHKVQNFVQNFWLTPHRQQTKIYCFTEDEMQVISKALVHAEYEFTTNHNLIVTDLPEEDDTSWHLDYSNILKLTQEAIHVVDKSGYIHKPEKCEPAPELQDNA